MKQLVTISDFEKKASENLTKNAYDYYRAGANGCHTLEENVVKFRDIKLKTSIFSTTDSKGKPNLETTILGMKVNSPICIASTAFQKMTHPQGEIAMARGAQASNHSVFMLSSWSTTPLEEVAAQAPDCLKMF